MYRKLRRIWSHNDMNHIPEFRKLFPELNNVSSEEMCDRWVSLGIDFYTNEETPVPFILRLTLPFAVIVFLLMFLFLPIMFIFTGKWGYGYSEHNRIFNWFNAIFK